MPSREKTLEKLQEKIRLDHNVLIISLIKTSRIDLLTALSNGQTSYYLVCLEEIQDLRDFWVGLLAPVYANHERPAESENHYGLLKKELEKSPRVVFLLNGLARVVQLKEENVKRCIGALRDLRAVFVAEIGLAELTHSSPSVIEEMRASFDWLVLPATAEELDKEAETILESSAPDLQDYLTALDKIDDSARQWLTELGLITTTPPIRIASRKIEALVGVSPSRDKVERHLREFWKGCKRHSPFSITTCAFFSFACWMLMRMILPGGLFKAIPAFTKGYTLLAIVLLASMNAVVGILFVTIVVRSNRGQLTRLTVLWLLFLATYVTLSGLLILAQSFYLLPASLGALFSLVSVLRLLIARQEEA